MGKTPFFHVFFHILFHKKTGLNASFLAFQHMHRPYFYYYDYFFLKIRSLSKGVLFFNISINSKDLRGYRGKER